jgi:uncharacterized protein
MATLPECSLTLPVRPERPDDRELRPFPDPEAAPPLAKTVLEPPEHRWTVKHDLGEATSTLEVI